MSPESIKLFIIVMSAVVTAVGLITLGIKFGNRPRVCAMHSELHTALNNKISYIQFLLMEITTEEQQKSAQSKLNAFDGTL
jgi:hypothetical protein